MPAQKITQTLLDALKTTLIAKFNAGLAASTEDWKKVAALIKSDGKSNTYAWLSQFPAFREWVGSRLHKKVAETAYTVPNRKFESTIDVQRTDIEDDSLGHYATIAASYGQAVADLKNDIIFTALAKGFSEVCYDGQFFFDTDHPVFPTEDGTGTAKTVSNMQAGTAAPWILLCTKRAPKAIYLQERMAASFDSQTTAASDNAFNLDVFSFGGRWRGDAAYGFWQCAFGSKAVLDEANFDAAYKAMMKFEGDGNRKLGITPDLLVVGPDNLAAAEKLLKAQYKAGGESNTNYGRVELFSTPWL